MQIFGALKKERNRESICTLESERGSSVLAQCRERGEEIDLLVLVGWLAGSVRILCSDSEDVFLRVRGWQADG